MKTIFAYFKRRDWDGLQSGWVLPTARRFYLVGAFIAIIATVAALATALFFQLASLGRPSGERVPDIEMVAPESMKVEALDTIFVGPQQITAQAEPLAYPVSQGAVVARLSATSTNALSEFQVIGGPSADLVSQSTDNGITGAELRATKGLTDRLNSDEKSGPREHKLVIRTIAIDVMGNQSPPMNVGFALERASGTTDKTSMTVTDSFETIDGPEALKVIAAHLARLKADRGTPEYFVAYNVAMRQPERCGAAGDDGFVREYARAFGRVKPKLSASSVDAFQSRTCELWSSRQEDAARAAAEANMRRMAIIARNEAIQAASYVRRHAALSARNVALSFAGSAIFFFMIVALFLAFMAIEGHSKAVQEALKLIAARRDDLEGK